MIDPVDSVIYLSNNVMMFLVVCLFCFLNSELFSFKSKSPANETPAGSESSSSTSSAAKIRVLNHMDYKTWKVSFKCFLLNTPFSSIVRILQCDYSNRASWSKVDQSKIYLRTKDSIFFSNKPIALKNTNNRY